MTWRSPEESSSTGLASLGLLRRANAAPDQRPSKTSKKAPPPAAIAMMAVVLRGLSTLKPEVALKVGAALLPPLPLEEEPLPPSVAVAARFSQLAVLTVSRPSRKVLATTPGCLGQGR